MLISRRSAFDFLPVNCLKGIIKPIRILTGFKSILNEVLKLEKIKIKYLEKYKKKIENLEEKKIYSATEKQLNKINDEIEVLKQLVDFIENKLITKEY